MWLHGFPEPACSSANDGRQASELFTRPVKCWPNAPGAAAPITARLRRLKHLSTNAADVRVRFTQFTDLFSPSVGVLGSCASSVSACESCSVTQYGISCGVDALEKKKKYYPQVLWQLRDGSGLLRKLRSLRLGRLEGYEAALSQFLPDDVSPIRVSHSAIDKTESDYQSQNRRKEAYN